MERNNYTSCSQLVDFRKGLFKLLFALLCKFQAVLTVTFGMHAMNAGATIASSCLPRLETSLVVSVT